MHIKNNNNNNVKPFISTFLNQVEYKNSSLKTMFGTDLLFLIFYLFVNKTLPVKTPTGGPMSAS